MFALPSVVEFIDYASHAVLDIIQHKGELFKPQDELNYSGVGVVVLKVLKNEPIKTEAKIENRLDIRKVRYFCNKK